MSDLEIQLQQMQQALARSEQRYTHLINRFPNGVAIIFDRELTIKLVGSAEFAQMGVSPETIVGKHLRHIVSPENYALIEPHFQAALQGAHPSFEASWKNRLYLVTLIPLADDNGHVDQIQTLAQEITERRKAQSSLGESEARFQQIWETTSDAMALSDPEGITLAVNPGYVSLYGFAEDALVDKSFTVIFPEENRAWAEEQYRKIFANEKAPEAFESVIRRADGSERIVESRIGFLTSNGQRSAMLSSIRDITERKQAEKQLHQSNHHLATTLAQLREAQQKLVQQERLAAVGQLAAGIAHDFNNILAAIMLHTQMATRIANLPSPVGKRLALILQQTERASDLVRQILDFSRQAVIQLRPVDIGILVEEEVALMKPGLPSYIQIVLNNQTDGCMVNLDVSRIRQLLVNLVTNAVYAMPEAGVLHIGLQQTGFEIPPIPLPIQAADTWIKLSISDTGSGIPADVLPHIFEPFFTTKPVGKGSGLGLSQVYGIVQQHNGHIDVQTAPGEGTRIFIYLPAMTMRTPQIQDEALPNGDGEAILLIERTPAMQAALIEILEMLNYRPVVAASGAEALKILADQGEEIALLLGDLGLPAQDETPLAKVLQSQNIQQPMIMLTDHPLADNRANAIPWLLKPPQLHPLAAMLAHAMKKRYHKEEQSL